MQLTPQQIAQFTTRAKQAGYSDSEIYTEIERKNQEVSAVQPTTQAPATAQIQQQNSMVTPPPPQAPPTPQIQQQAPMIPPQVPAEAASEGKGILRTVADFIAPKLTSVGSAAWNTAGMAKDYIDYQTAQTPEQKQMEAKSYTERRNKANEAMKEFGFDANKQGNQFDPAQYAKGTTQGALESGSFAVPAGKTFKAAAGLGAISGALRGASEAEGIGDLPSKVVGGTTGGAVGGTLALGAQKLVSKVAQSFAERTANSVFKEPIKATKALMTKGDSLGNQALEKGMQGSSEGIFNKAQNAINELENGLQDLLFGSDGKVSTDGIRESLKPLISKYIQSGNTEATQAVLNRIQSIEDANGANMPIAAANEIKRALYDELNSSYGQQSTAGKEGLKAIAKSLKEQIEKSVPEVSQINKDLSFYGRVSKSMIDKMSRDGRNNMLGLTDAIISGGLGPVGVAITGLRHSVGSTGGKTLSANVANKLAKSLLNPGITKAGQVASGIIGTKAASIFKNSTNNPTEYDSQSGIDKNLPHNSNSITQNQPPQIDKLGQEQGLGATPQDAMSQPQQQSLGASPPVLNPYGATPKELYREYVNASRFGDTVNDNYIWT